MCTLSKCFHLSAAIRCYQSHSHDQSVFFADDANMILVMTVMMVMILVDQFKLVVTNVFTPSSKKLSSLTEPHLVIINVMMS